MSSATRTAFWLLLTGVLWLTQPHALALNSALDVSQYAHTAWRIGDGVVKGSIHAIAQTPDGFLWLGTDSGLVRFDGVQTSPWQPPQGEVLPGRVIRNLLVSRDGALWIATDRGLARWSRGELVSYPQFEEMLVNGLLQDRQGAVWVSASYLQGQPKLCAFRGDSSNCYDRDGSFGSWAGAISEDRDGNVWVDTAKGLWRWQPGPSQLFLLPGTPIGGLHSLSGTSAGGILALRHLGAYQIIDGKVTEYRGPPASRGWLPDSVLTDRDGGVWISEKDAGLLHFHNGRTDEYGLSDGLSGDYVQTFFEDREGNVWVSTNEGLDRFRALSATIYSTPQGVVGWGASVLADRDGSVWFSTSRGLYRWQEGHLALYRPPHEKSYRKPQRSMNSGLVREIVMPGIPESPSGSLFQDHNGTIWLGTTSGLGHLEDDRFESIAGVPVGYIDSIAEDRDGNLWIAHRNAGLLELSSNRVVQQIPWAKISQSGHATRMAVDPVHGGLWLGFFSGGIVRLLDGQVRSSYGFRDGLGKGRVDELRIAPNGILWVATEGGLSRLKAGHIATLSTRDGLPCDNVVSSVEDEDSLWVYTACGLVRIAQSDLHSWIADLEQAQTRRSRVPLTVLDNSDGVRSSLYPVSSFSPHSAGTADGRLWLVAANGLLVVDRRHLPVNKLPPPVRVERIIADRVPSEGRSLLQLPPLSRDLEIDYTALSLVAPEKIQFRYKLEGRDRDWQEVGNRRTAFFADLPPGSYRFRVIASNNSGVWNEEGDSLEFSVEPAFWQTIWFRTLCGLAFLGLLWMLYQLRLRQVTRTFELGLETRVAERTRIARELHDTLLQSFQGLLLRFQTASRLLPTRPTEAKEVLESTMDQAEQALADGRDAVEGLRPSAVESYDLAEAVKRVGEELAGDPARDRFIPLTLRVEGTPQELQPIVRDEIYRIAGEALRNAYRHSGATNIEVELQYDARQFELRVRDDGKGIDSKFLGEAGRGKHFGLTGMRERAAMIGGKLTLWTSADSGTEIDLAVPGSRAYRASPRRRSWLGRLPAVAGEREP
jgi:signal transduction histidine kinase/ligand-binding sensor domain-containing protein